ncbi:carboxymuconolactone decarboxylase family protein [Litoreibacter albidus]|uniref:Alkylhydroperoxidase AhpD family core domain-containing protein n=1 Tax=Litoreibacter albidus TaxID=670155 RepID=A0A1H2VLI0_9RHOB|nr:carboxymuconolactone decarboxylase family protein [Litoreibacter albidus]SDW69176.1 alkylhydroperoxidase AhpD family core domain-containing protein [Litoreibacter albidus]
MTNFTVHTEDSAPEASKEFVAKSIAANGRLPGLHGVMAEAPGLLEGYQKLHELFLDSSFDKDELTVVWQAINVENDCHYCVPAHTGIAKMMKVDDDITEALRNETPLPNARLEALRTFTLQLVRDRGYVSDDNVQAFLDAGYTQRNILEVILGYSQKIMSNYTNHLAKTPVDKVFEKFAWSRDDAAA